MDFSFNDDQQMLMTSLETLLGRYREAPQGIHGYVSYSEELQNELDTSGFLSIASQPDFGALEAALLVEEVASCPVSVEVASSALVAPLLDIEKLPLTIASAWDRPIRFLGQSRYLAIVTEREVKVAVVEPENHQPEKNVIAYPMARLVTEPEYVMQFAGEKAAAIRRRVLIGIAAEAAGLMRGALQNTVEFVKQREQFGQPLGDFQAIQHRLAESAQMVRACRNLALKAADQDDDLGASVASLYAQDAIRKVNYDCHQFSGAMGLTLEFPLHLWTYRLKFLQGELGGKAASARLLSSQVWGSSAGQTDRPQSAVV